MSIRNIRIRMEALGRTLQSMRVPFTSHMIIDRWNGRSIIPLAMEYHVPLADDDVEAVIIVTEEGFQLSIGWSLIMKCWYFRKAGAGYLSVMGHEHEILATMKVRTR